MTDDFRRKPRRRGEKLKIAIIQAVLAELAEHGYARFTVEGVAVRADRKGVDLPALIYAPFLSGATVPAEELLTQLVDEVILPLFRAGS